MAVLQGRTYTLAVLAGTDGRDYARTETLGAGTGYTLWDQMLTDLVATIAAAASVGALSPGVDGGTIRSNGSAWVRVSDLGALKRLHETETVSATAATGTVNYDYNTQSILNYTTSASANWVLNVRGDASTTFSSLIAVGECVTVVFKVTQGATPYYPTSLTIDGSANTPKWQGGSAPSAGNASSVDVYVYAITKTAATPTYTVLASQTKFA